MKINEITIQNFRNIGEKKTFHFHQKFTAIIGINGKGKSSILHAMRIACGTFFLNIPEVKKRHILESEIRVKDFGKLLVEQIPVCIEATGTFPDVSGSVVWRRQILKNSNITTSSEGEVGKVRAIGKQKYDEVTNGNDKVGLPLIAFLGTARAHGAGRKREKRTGRKIFKEGYHDWQEMKATTFKYADWLLSYDILLTQKKEYPNTKKAFFAAIKTANPYIQQIEVMGDQLWVKIKIDDYESEYLPIELHSDGIRFFTEMVAELAYRCIILNGYLDDKAIEETNGIVLIDEIDLHLHPNWQHRVVGDLKKAFPNVQFVVTTHSPFIIQNLESDEVIDLDSLIVSDIAPNELPISKVITDIMHVKNIRSDDFIKRYEQAKEELEKIENQNSKLTLNDYQRISDLLGKVLKEETNDPIYKAYLEDTNKNEDETNK